ncbi:transcriptional regulator, TetR family [Austwickia chelonae]|uniref:Putative TetR family transcriptional regulator n=1 Tax=Austwickia chelonae NBRC 105200 TaxID=1184607 RepID=K6VV89_9MICO|nr:TetR/AcrR family transcriptional regulator [Austwickia chelonae]GAB79260.1 putative TetR family transcriptional regulator [Austwickia chelonae NBRC 105200]SEW37685.1 transcriptional regulator, TetR family [Austwickia chelonae]
MITSPEPGVLGARRKRPGYDGESILAVAVEVFNRHGYEGTSMGVLAENLGISKAGIYYHVNSKEDLLQRACDRALCALESAFEEEISAPGTARERLEAVVRRAVHVLHDELPYVTLLLRVRGNTEVERAALERRRRFDLRFASLVEAAPEEGALRADADALLITRFVYGTVNSLVEWYRPDGGHDAEVVADALAAMVFHGLDARGPGSAELRGGSGAAG